MIIKSVLSPDAIQSHVHCHVQHVSLDNDHAADMLTKCNGCAEGMAYHLQLAQALLILGLQHPLKIRIYFWCTNAKQGMDGGTCTTVCHTAAYCFMWHWQGCAQLHMRQRCLAAFT